MSSFVSSVAIAVCLSIFVGAFGFALGRRHCGCEPDVLADAGTVSNRNIANPGPLAVANTASPDNFLVRDAVEITPTRDVASLSRIAVLEAEVARLTTEVERLRQQNAITEFASRMVALSPESPDPLTLALALRMMDMSHLTKDPELRTHFVREVRLDAALDLLKAEPRFCLALTRAYSDGTPEWREHEWPAHRDRLVSAFFRQLAEAGLSQKAIELYRVQIAELL